MKDPQIRKIIRETKLREHLCDSHSKVVEELNLPIGGARIDVAVINGHFHGYEIKSASDTLKRLPNQLIAYSYVFDYLTIVTEEKYYNKILTIIPDWVEVAVCSDEFNSIEVAKKGSLNPNKNGFYIAKLLWHNELVEVLTENNIPFKKKYRNWILCEILSQHVSIDKLSDFVREKLKNRQNWKVKEASVLA